MARKTPTRMPGLFWFSELTDKKLRRGAHRSVRGLNADIRAWIDTWNDDLRPFVWTKTADQILDSIARYCDRINASRNSSAVVPCTAIPTRPKGT